MSKPDTFVKNNFDHVNTVSFSVQQTRNVAQNLAEQISKIGIVNPIYSIVGYVGSGNTNLADGLRAHYLPDISTSIKTTSRLLENCHPTWQMWADEDTSVQVIDMIKMDSLSEPIVPGMKHSNVQVFKHASDDIQSQSVAVLQIVGGVDRLASQETRIINVYLNPKLLSDHQRRNIILRP